MRINSRYWVITDIETSGVRPDKHHEILQIARVVYDAVNKKMVPDTLMMSYVRPQWWNWRDPEALLVNKLDDEQFLKVAGVSLSEALGNWSRGIDWEESVVAAWGIDFESRFLSAAYTQTNRVIPYPYQMVDLRTLAYMNSDLGCILGLRESAEVRGILFDVQDQHDAMYDVMKEMEVVDSVIGGEFYGEPY